MSWDIFIQSIPKKYKSMAEIPEGYEPKPLCANAAAVKAVRSVLPGIVFGQGFAAVQCDDGTVEIDLGIEDPVMCVMLACRGGEGILPLVCALVKALGGRAFDTFSDSGIFDPDAAAMSLATFNAYRAKAAAPKATKTAKRAKAAKPTARAAAKKTPKKKAKKATAKTRKK